jgi:branched-chain amino acid transport system permease protein
MTGSLSKTPSGGWKIVGPLGAFTVLAFAIPALLSSNRYLAFVAGITLIHIVWTSGMNLLYGYTGLMPLMFAGIAGISAYFAVDLTASGWSFWAALPVGALAASIAGTILGLPSLRLKGFYFTLCSLVIQTVITLGFVYFANLTNGDTGISQIPMPAAPGGETISPPAFDLVLAATAVISVIVLIAITRSALGKRLIAIREDDELAEMLGINVTRYKMTAFFIGSLFAGVGGALYAPYIGFISPRSFDVLISMNIWLMVAFGGRGTIWGPVAGAVILVPLSFLLQEYYTVKDVIYGLLIIAVIVLMPGGIASGLKRTTRTTEPVAAGAAEQRGAK